jgi:hypothetical protein
MRLLRLEDDGTFSLVEFIGNELPPYAILSHTWGPSESEVTYKDIVDGTGKTKAGYKKIRLCGKQAAINHLSHFWVDTCCIDKTSSAELSEAINSMYLWYQEAQVCFVYLEDVLQEVEISTLSMANVRWFSRGWTLQELIATRTVEFYASDWTFLGTKISCCDALSAITGVHALVLQNVPVERFSIAQRMSWASKRITTRPEDTAYCLLGIFGVNMPLLYGEGAKRAFIRLQEEIMKDSDDQSLFAWIQPQEPFKELRGLLADSPAEFAFSGDIVPVRNLVKSNPFSKTNAGLRISLPLSPLTEIGKQENDPYGDCRYGALDCVKAKGKDPAQLIALFLYPLSYTNDGDQYMRVGVDEMRTITPEMKNICSWEAIYVRNQVDVNYMETVRVAKRDAARRARLQAWVSRA